MKRLVLAFLLAAACGTPPEFLPPPFGPSGPGPTRLFFPTGLARLPDGSLLVVNSNSNHAYDGGSVVSIKKSYLDAFFAKQLQCQKLAAPEFAFQSAPNDCNDDVGTHPGDVFGGAVIIGNYAGPLALNDAGNLAITGSRDTARINAVSIAADLSLSCAPNAGVSSTDCRKGVVDLTGVGVVGPYSIVPGDSITPGQPPRRVFYVASMSPRIDQIVSGQLTTSAVVAALDMGNPGQVLFSMLSAPSQYVAAGAAVGPMVFDPSRRELLMSGCFQRFASGGAGEPGTTRCSLTNNWLRFLDVDAQGAALVHLFDLYGDVLSVETIALALADPDPVTRIPATLWATMHNPDVLVQVDLPALPSVAPRVRRVVPLPISPADILRLPRAGKPDLLAIVSEKLGAVAFYDTGQGQIVGQLENLGDSPFALQLLSSDGVTARIAATVFRSCRVALIEVPLDAPWQAALRGRAGVCQ